MKTLAILAAASLAWVGCDQQRDSIDEAAGAEKDQIEQASEAQKQALDEQKEAIEQSTDQSQEQISEQARAEKERLESQAEARQAQLDAQKKQIEAQADAAKAEAEAQAKQAEAQNEAARADANAQPIDEAAGAANTTALGATETDRTLSKQVHESLQSQNAGLTGVTIMSADGKVTLRGTVSSEAKKQALEAQVKAVSGVKSVDNKLEVKSE